MLVGLYVGNLLGADVGSIVGATVGTEVGVAVGETVGVYVGSAEGSYVGSGVNLCMHLVHASCKFCKPDTNAYTVSPVVCSVSSSTHWSSWVIILAEP